MIVGIGNDIIEVDRIAASIQRYGRRFLDRIYTSEEQRYCLRYAKHERHFAGRFAAKEAVIKALGTGFREGMSWLDVEIVNGATGAPFVVMSAMMKVRFHDPQVMVSISHCRSYATAVAIVV